MPHRVTQRGNRRQETFFIEDDYEAYLDLMADRCREEGLGFSAYCLTPNHSHLIAILEEQLRQMRNHVRTGRPLGGASFAERVE